VNWFDVYLPVNGKENDGAYSVQDDDGEHILYLLSKRMMLFDML
jgi:hypothetical protein